MDKAKINLTNKFQYASETTCRIFVLLVGTLYLLSIPFDGYIVIANWKYHIFLALYFGFILIIVEQKLISNKKAIRNRQGLDIFSLSLRSYFLITCLSGLVSQYSGTFLGNGRHEGVLTIGLYVISTLLLMRYFCIKKWMLFAFGTAITMFCILGIVQLTGANPFYLYPQDMNFYDAGSYYMGQYWSTIGNTNLCAALLSMAVGTFAAMSVRASKKTDWIALVPLTLSVFCISELNSEAGLVALIVGLLLMPPFVVATGKDVPNFLLTYGVILLTLAVSAVTVFFNGGITLIENRYALVFGVGALMLLSCGWLVAKSGKARFIKPTTLRKSLLCLVLGFMCIGFCTLYFYNRFPDGFLLQAHELLHGNWDNSYGSNRLYIWRQVWNLIRESPILGGGPDTLGLRGLEGFSRYNESTGTIVTSSIDVAHNEYLNILVNQGALALLTYLIAIFTSIIRWWKYSGDNTAAISGAAVLFYLIQACFGISMCITAPYLWIALAVLNKKTERNEKNETRKKTHCIKLGTDS